MSNRREFIAAATGGVMLAGLGATASAAACPAVMQSRRVGGSPSLQMFESLQGEALQLVGTDGMVAQVQLLAVHDAMTEQRRLEQFTLVMRGSGSDLPAGLYQVSHRQTGVFAMRVDLGGHDDTGALYRADFSLLT